jgi:rod shape-determining protein MreC
LQPKNKKILGYLLLFFIFTTPFIFFSSHLRPWEIKSGPLLVVQELIHPIEYLWNKTTHQFVCMWEQYIALHHAAKENVILKKKILELQSRMLDYTHQFDEAARLRDLLGFSRHFNKELILAEVLNESGHHEYPTLRLAKGRLHGLDIGMPVVSAKGIIGKIVRTGLMFSDVQILSDHNSYLDVLIERTRVRGVLKGLGENLCRLQLHNRADVRIGDTIVSTGAVGAIPKGLPVGRVVKISYDSDNVSQFITIQPWENYNSLDEVMVLQFHDSYIDKLRKTAGNEWMDKALGNNH